jgi:hypothetical protein
MSVAIERISVLTSCTASKVATEMPLPAERLYAGQHHARLMRGVDDARAAGLDVRVAIVSAGHGVVAGDDRIQPYEQTFQGRPADARRRRARDLGIPRAARAALARPADVHVVLLGEDYLAACELGPDLAPSAPAFVICAAGTALRLPPVVNVHPIPLTTEDTRRFRCGLVGLKGEVGRRLLAHIARDRPAVSELGPLGLVDRLASVPSRPTAATAMLFS